MQTILLNFNQANILAATTLTSKEKNYMAQLLALGYDFTPLFQASSYFIRKQVLGVMNFNNSNYINELKAYCQSQKINLEEMLALLLKQRGVNVPTTTAAAAATVNEVLNSLPQSSSSSSSTLDGLLNGTSTTSGNSSQTVPANGNTNAVITESAKAVTGKNDLVKNITIGCVIIFGIYVGYRLLKKSNAMPAATA
jgi:hypothetical protein